MDEKEFLDLFKISEGKYIIGIFQNTITVYRQQMRALNIFNALVNQGTIQFASDFSIAIIGGGIAGLTFAATALKSNISVTLFEKEADYLHMQQGCDTRKIHPNIYDWPDVGSTFPNARLPVLSWTHDTASNVVKQIENGLSEISAQIIKSGHQHGPALFRENKSSKIESITEPTEKTKNKFTITHGDPKIKSYANLIIYAVGYGVEKRLKESNTPSYWRNDSLSQSVLNDKRHFFISGTGDGALIDLCRIKLRKYSYDRILNMLKSNPKKYELLITELRKIKHLGNSTANLAKDFYDTEFSMLNPNYYAYFQELLNKDLVNKNTVILHSKRQEEHILDFKKVSMLNAFIVYLLKLDNQFEFRRGEKLEYKEGNYYLDDAAITNVDQFVIRHGTDTFQVTDEMYLNDAEKARLTELEELQKKTTINANCWSFDSISNCFKKGSLNPDYAVLPYLKRSEYVTPDTKAICLSSTITLARTISRLIKSGKHFRIALLRTIKFDGQDFFQQITPYQGSKKVDGDGCFGNVYPIDHGIVGQVVHYGQPIFIKNREETEFKKLLSQLNLCKDHKGPVTGKSFLAIPVTATTKEGKMATNLVLYIESENIDFLDNKGIFDVILASLQGLVDSIEQMIDSNMIIMNELEFEPFAVDGLNSEEIKSSGCFEDLEDESSTYYNSKTSIKFKEYHSFDIIYNK